MRKLTAACDAEQPPGSKDECFGSVEPIPLLMNGDEYEGSWKTCPWAFGVSLVSQTGATPPCCIICLLLCANLPEVQTDTDCGAQQKPQEPHIHFKP